MMIEDDLNAFVNELRTEVEEAVLAGEPYSQPVFTRIVLDRLAEEGVIENPTPLDQEGSFGNAKYKITGFSLDEEEERLVLVTTIYKDQNPPQAIPVDEIRLAADRAVRFFTCSTRGLHEKIEPSLTDASELARRLYELRDRISFIRVFVLSDGLVGSRSFDDLIVGGTRITYELYGIERLFRVLGEGVSREDIVVDLTDHATGGVPCLPVPAVDGSYQGYLVALPGAALADAYERYGTRLLELNVRAFLGVSGRKSVNAGLRATLKEEPANFLAFNNGIVATVDHIDIDTKGGIPRITKLQGLQIVNGGQTTASIHRARRIDGQKLHAVLVPAKIIVVPPDNLSRMVVAISKSANSQNTVQPADFSANDPFHVRVEHLANNVWLTDGTGRWFYERARGTYGAQEARASVRATSKKAFARETPKERRFAKTDLAKYLNVWEGHPDQVSYGNQKNFQLFMQRQRDAMLDVGLLDEDWFRRLVAIAIIFGATVKIVRAEKFAAYQANIAAYTVACLSWQTGGRIDVDEIWRRQTISPELAAMLKTWAHEIDALLRDTAGARMPTEAAKRPETWEAIRNRAPELHNPLPPELAAQNSAARSAGSGRSSKAAANLTAVDPAKISETRANHVQTLLAATGELPRASTSSGRAAKVSDVGDALAELTDLSPAQFKELFDGCKARTRAALKVMVEGPTPAFRVADVARAVGCAAYELPGVWSGITKRIRTVTGDRTAYLWSWDDDGVNDKNGRYKDQGGAISETTYRSGRRVLISKP